MNPFVNSAGWGNGAYGIGPCGHGPWMTAPFTPTQRYVDDQEYRVDVVRMEDASEQRYLLSRAPARRFSYEFPDVDSGGTAAVESWYHATGGSFARFWTLNHRTGFSYVAVFEDAIQRQRGTAMRMHIGGFTLRVARAMSYAEAVRRDQAMVYLRLGYESDSGPWTATSVAISNSGYQALTCWGVKMNLDNLPRAYPDMGLLVGDPNGAMAVNCTGTYVTCETVGNIATNTAPVFMEAWVQPTGGAGYPVTAGYPTIGNVRAQLYGEYGIRISSGRPQFHIDNLGRGVAEYVATGSDVLSPTQRHHLVGGRVGSSCCLYVNGTLVASTICPELMSMLTSARFMIGGYFNATAGAPVVSSGAFIGTIDEFALYTSSLTGRQIREHYLIGIGATA